MNTSEVRVQPEGHIVLYDGVCPLCNGAVRLLLKIDKREVLTFAPLQGEFARNALDERGLRVGDEMPQSIIFISDTTSTHSDALISILKEIGGIWSVAAGMLALAPRVLRDAAYRFVARRRYTWFGKYDECAIPDPHHQSRFLL